MSERDSIIRIRGLRNSFGIAFDPFTETMWGTENGDDSSDEINLVYPYMNSGWNMVMGRVHTGAQRQARIPHCENNRRKRNVKPGFGRECKHEVPAVLQEPRIFHSGARARAQRGLPQVPVDET